jgi:hypothetical protein
MRILPIYFKKWLLIFPCAGIIFFSFPAPKSYSMDPVTIAILAPILMPYAQQAGAYALKGCIRKVPGWIKAGTQFLNIFRLPLGVLQLTLGAPFGFLNYGIENTWKGGIAPFLMVKEILCMPLYFFGVM